MRISLSSSSNDWLQYFLCSVKPSKCQKKQDGILVTSISPLEVSAFPKSSIHPFREESIPILARTKWSLPKPGWQGIGDQMTMVKQRETRSYTIVQTWLISYECDGKPMRKAHNLLCREQTEDRKEEIGRPVRRLLWQPRKDNSSLYLGSGDRVGEKWLETRYILNIEPKELVDGP